MPLRRSFINAVKYSYFLTVVVLALTACSHHYKNPHIEIQTSMKIIPINKAMLHLVKW